MRKPKRPYRGVSETVAGSEYESLTSGRCASGRSNMNKIPKDHPEPTRQPNWQMRVHSHRSWSISMWCVLPG